MFNEAKYCASCTFHDPRAGVCALTKRAVEDTDYCSSHSTNPTVCATCQRYIVGHSFLEKVNNRYIEICGNCATALSTCAGCKNAVCQFETNPDPLPKTILKQIRQGNAIIQTTVVNLERVKKFCEPCPCFCKEDYACNREFNCCNRHTSILNS